MWSADIEVNIAEYFQGAVTLAEPADPDTRLGTGGLRRRCLTDGRCCLTFHSAACFADFEFTLAQ